jgi:hypothetical protein
MVISGTLYKLPPAPGTEPLVNRGEGCISDMIVAFLLGVPRLPSPHRIVTGISGVVSTVIRHSTLIHDFTYLNSILSAPG